MEASCTNHIHTGENDFCSSNILKVCESFLFWQSKQLVDSGLSV